jgi:hypothetical protein
MTKFYHGTDEYRAELIEAEGFLGSELSEFTDGFKHVSDGVVFLTDKVEEAVEYGGIVFEVEFCDDVEPTFFQESPNGPGNEFYVSVAAMNRSGLYRRIGGS